MNARVRRRLIGYRLPTETEWEYAARAGTDLLYTGSNTVGNVFEWTADWYGESYYSSSPTTDPTGPESGSLRVARSGSWDYEGSWARVAKHRFADPDGHEINSGFRVVKTIP